VNGLDRDEPGKNSSDIENLADEAVVADAEQRELLMGRQGLLRVDQHRDPDGLEESDLGHIDDQVHQCGVTTLFVETGANGVMRGEIEVAADRYHHDCRTWRDTASATPGTLLPGEALPGAAGVGTPERYPGRVYCAISSSMDSTGSLRSVRTMRSPSPTNCNPSWAALPGTAVRTSSGVDRGEIEPSTCMRCTGRAGR